MLLGSIGVLALAIALCWGLLGGAGVLACGGIFVLGYIVLVLLAFLFLWAVTSAVDQKVPQEHDSRFYRWIIRLYVPAVMSLLRIRMDFQGQEKLPKDGRFLMVCNHLSILDPVVLLGCFPKSQLAFISKQENSAMFIIGNLMHKIMCQKINRENDREALKTILKCIQMLKNDEVSVCVFPEGYTSRDGKLHHFRSGVFKIATKTQVPIVVCSLQNTEKVFHNAKRLRSTDVRLHVIGVIRPEDFQGRTAVDISQEAYDLMLADLGEAFLPEDEE